MRTGGYFPLVENELELLSSTVRVIVFCAYAVRSPDAASACTVMEYVPGLASALTDRIPLLMKSP